jgi:hypothetical protein
LRKFSDGLKFNAKKKKMSYWFEFVSLFQRS